MDTIWIIVIAFTCGVAAGGFGGYRWGRAAEAKFHAIEQAAVSVKKVL